jgi:hypothetical protein
MDALCHAGRLWGNIIYRVLSDHNGVIWIASDGGISRFDPRKEKEGAPLSGGYFSRLQVAGEDVRLGETGAEVIPPLELRAAQNNLTIAFVAPNYQDPTHVSSYLALAFC